MPDEKIVDIFSYHPPTKEQAEIYNAVNKAFIECALKVNGYMPEGPGMTVAIRKLSEARMAVNAAIALEGRF